MRAFFVIEPGFALLLIAVITAFGIDGAAQVFAAAIIHEAGHLAAIAASGGKVYRMRAGAGGLEIVTGSGKTYFADIAAAAAGPLFSLAAALLSAKLGGGRWRFFTGVNTALCAFNLLPLSVTDGGRMLKAALSWILGPDIACKAARILDAAVLAVMLCAGAYCLLRGRNPTMLICCAVLIKECCKAEKNSVELL